MLDPTSAATRVRVDRVFDEADRRFALHDATRSSLNESPRSIPPVWLYDARGSQLFDEITRLPEYYLSRRETEILVERAEEIATRTRARTLIELGSGTAEKTCLLLDALDEVGTLECFMPLDVSEEVLRASAAAIAERYASLRVHALVADFGRQLSSLPDDDERIVAFLGSTIGNLDPSGRARLLAEIASVLTPTDAFLLGVDLVKAPDRIVAAYNDSRGVTEQFVRNGLDALNVELDANFRHGDFDYVAAWDVGSEWMDIGFRARSRHTVSVRGLGTSFELERGEPLRMEISTKFRRDVVEEELAVAGLVLEAWWTDPAGDFALALSRRRTG